MQDAAQRLEQGVDALLESDNFARYLRAMARFHNYSWGNVLLIVSQRPDASRVAGYRTWQALDRQVKRGERGITILVPRVRRIADAPEDDQATNDRAEGAVVSFGTGYVFDIAQTEGAELPTPPVVEALATATDRGAALYDALVRWLERQGVAVQVSDDLGEANGAYAPRRKVVLVNRRLIGADQAAKTLAHEAAHYAASHTPDMPPADVESVAEGSAYVIAAHFGLDSQGYSFGYIAQWAQDKTVLRRNLAAIQKTAQAVIDGLESADAVVGAHDLCAS